MKGDFIYEAVAFEHWLSRGFMYNAESDTLCPISYEFNPDNIGGSLQPNVVKQQ